MRATFGINSHFFSLFYILACGFLCLGNPIVNRLEQYNKAITVRYGDGHSKGDAKAALPIFEELANAPNDTLTPLIMHELGKIYLYGFNQWFSNARDLHKATEYFNIATRLAHAPSMFYLAFIYSLDQDRQQDSIPLLQRASRSNYLPALLAMGYRNLHGPDSNVTQALEIYKQAFKIAAKEYDSLVFVTPTHELKLHAESIDAYRANISVSEAQHRQNQEYWESKANQGDSYAKYEMAKCSSGNESNAPKSSALSLLKEAADAHVPDAMRDLGIMYLSGKGVPKNKKMGIQLLERALEFGDVDSANYLGYIFYSGQYGITPNDELAIYYFKIGAQNEMAESFFFLGEIATKYAAQKASNDLYKIAFNYYQTAADYGLLHAFQREAIMLCRGIGVAPNESRATLNYKIIAEAGFSSVLSDEIFTQVLQNDYESAIINCLLGAFVGLATCQWNATLLMAQGYKLPIDNIHSMVMQYASQCYAQGDFTIEKLLGILAQDSKQYPRALYHYYRGFKQGDCDCIDPCIDLYSRDKNTIDKSLVLLEYKHYRLINHDQGNKNVFNKHYDTLKTWLHSLSLKTKGLLYSIF
ncbi:bifunctional Sel1-like repeat/Tetratricopeptide-like helical domain superfamily [Babesia duncani]|uniref:Bifunctional Sel1-like repeat/Tetratricopeptide-like helical domain superfamily n=1 Tax=Babesia duncani TaxID=323732 RepID=A0AAD9PL91_9APIC|nr:bifunctional Sel1-like repeat/Tetratricopeptide-like helical domain superfamily [Babesia duncani]